MRVSRRSGARAGKISGDADMALIRILAQQCMQQVVLEGDVSGQCVMALAQEQRMIERKIDIAVADHRRVERLASEQGCFGHDSVSGLEHQPIIIHARNRLRDFRWPQADFRNSLDFLHYQPRRRQGAVAAKHDHPIVGTRNGHGERPDEAPGPLEVLFEIALEHGQLPLALLDVGRLVDDAPALAGIENRLLEAAPDPDFEQIPIERFAITRHQPVIESVREGLVNARHRREGFGGQTAQTDFSALDESVQRLR